MCRLRVQPRGGRNDFVGPVGDRLRIRICSPPVDGEANETLIRYLAKQFRVTRSNVRIVSGRRGRDKLVEIDSPGKIPDKVLGCIG